MPERIKLTKENFAYEVVSTLWNRMSHGKLPKDDPLVQQILDDYTIITEFDQGAWKSVIDYIRDAKVKRGQLIGENLLLHDTIDKIKEFVRQQTVLELEGYKTLQECAEAGTSDAWWLLKLNEILKEKD